MLLALATSMIFAPIVPLPLAMTVGAPFLS